MTWHPHTDTGTIGAQIRRRIAGSDGGRPPGGTAASSRTRGVGRALLRELRERAETAGCTSLELDSGVQRFDAHRFSQITAHHFGLQLRAIGRASDLSGATRTASSPRP